MKKRYGFIFADEMEFQPFAELALNSGGVYLTHSPMNVIRYEADNAEIIGVECGIGKVNAAFGTMVLILDHHVDAVLNAGLSGAIQRFHKGDVVAGTSYVECDFDLSAFGYPVGQKSDGTRFHTPDKDLLAAAEQVDGVLTGRLGTGDFFLADPVKKDEYKEVFDIEAFDMETAAIAAVCNRLNVPFLSVRKISDDAGDAATDSYTEMNALAESHLCEVLLQIVENV